VEWYAFSSKKALLLNLLIVGTLSSLHSAWHVFWVNPQVYIQQKTDYWKISNRPSYVLLGCLHETRILMFRVNSPKIK
jgi:hypothetical protein